MTKALNITLLIILLNCFSVFSQTKTPVVGPFFKGKYKEESLNLQDFIKKHATYPPDAMLERLQGVVTVTFNVLPNGRITNITANEINRPKLEKEAIRIVSLMQNQWKPATQNGKAVSAKRSIKIEFLMRAITDLDHAFEVNYLDEKGLRPILP
jgi:TonB family protein